MADDTEPMLARGLTEEQWRASSERYWQRYASLIEQGRRADADPLAQRYMATRAIARALALLHEGLAAWDNLPPDPAPDDAEAS